MKTSHKIIKLIGLITLIASPFIAKPVQANISAYYYTEPASGRPGYGYTPGQACGSVPIFGGGRAKDFVRVIETSTGSSELCYFIMRDYYDNGSVYVHELKGRISKANHSCPGSLDYSVYSKTCEQPSDLSKANLAKNLGAPSDVGVLPTCQGSAGGTTTMVGNPIDASTGNKFQQEVDYQSVSAMPLIFVRSYNSEVDSSTRLGANWRDNYDRIIHVEGDKATVTRDDGKQVVFIKTADGWQSDPDVVSQLIPIADGWIYKTTENTEETYNAAGQLTSIKTLNGLTQTLDYDDQHRLIAITDSFGRKLQFNYDANNRIHELINPAGGKYQYNYDGNNNLISIIYPDDTQKQYLYGDSRFPHALTGIIDENGNRYATYAYDDKGRAVLSEHANGADKVTLEYNQNNTTSVIGALQQVRNYRFQVYNGVIKTTLIEGGPCAECGDNTHEYTYDARGFLTGQKDFNGNLTNYTYDSRGLQEGRTEAANTPIARTTVTRWDTHFRLPDEITTPQLTTKFTYDDKANFIAKTESSNGDARTWYYQYNDRSLLTDINDPLNHHTHYEYDGAGNLIKIVNALDQVTEITRYDVNGLPLEIKNPNNVVTELKYDARGRLTSYQTASQLTQLSYDKAGNLIQITKPSGAYLHYAYDEAHRLKEIEDNLHNKITYTLDALGHPVFEKVTNSTGQLTWQNQNLYDKLAQLTANIGGAYQETSYTYDANGNVTSTQDGLDYKTSYVVDALNRIIKVTDPANQNTEYQYDSQDNLTQVKDPKGLATNYSYDGFANLLHQISPDSGTTHYTYDMLGNLSQQTNAEGITANYHYDALNRLNALTYNYNNIFKRLLAKFKTSNIGQVNIYYHYDEGQYGIGHLTSMQDGSGSSQYQYDAQGNLTQQINHIQSQAFTTQYVYDADNRLSDIIYPDNVKVHYTRDASGQITKVELLTSDNSYTLANNITYLPFGPIAHLEYGNGIKADQKYDLDYRLLEQVFTSGTITSKYGYYWDLNDQLKQTSNSAYNQNFNYDVLGRLLSASSAGNYGTFTYTYDANNNRLTQKINTNTETYTYASNSNQLLTIKNGTEEKNYTYTATGNIKQISSNNAENKEFVYNFADQLSQIIQGTTYTQYYYNGLGQRVHANVGATHYYYIYDQTGNRIAEQDNQGNIRDYIYLNDQPVAVVEHTSTQPVTAQHIYYYQLDQRQTPIQLTNNNRTVVWQGNYQPFGMVDEKKTTIKNNLRLPGQYAAQATGYYYNYFRDYDPAIGRYLEVDPIGLAGGINSYGYAEQNPNNNIDYFGLSPKFNHCILSCTLEHFGLSGIIGGTAVAAGMPIIPKTAKPSALGSGAKTSIASAAFSKVLPYKLPVAVSAPTFRNFLSKSKVVGRVVGRWIPIIGLGVLGYDVINISLCTKKCLDNKVC